MRSNASVPEHSVHPDREELTAWQAGALAGPAGARIVAHMAGCAECAGVVSAVERGRAALASLEEPELPPGLHERLAAAIGREGATVTPERAAARVSGGTVRTRRTRAWTPRVAALSAAAALVLLVAGLVPVLRHFTGESGTRQASGGASVSRPGGAPSAAAPSSAASALPVFAAPGGFSGRVLRTEVADDQAIRSAYAQAGAGAPGAAHASPPAGSGSATVPAPRSLQNQGKSSGESAAYAVDQQACLAQVHAKAPGDARPAFFVDTVYRGRPATVLVTRRADAPDQAELWAFPRGDCSVAPFASERVQIPSP
jgi:hypothetical protein